MKKMKKLIVLAASFVLVATFAMTAAAADWNFYGSALIETFWTDSETIDTGESTDGFDLKLNGDSHIGASVKVSDELSGKFEYGTEVDLRHLYAEWNFGAGSLLVGQTDSPLYISSTSTIAGGDTGGGVSSGRHPMLRLKFGNFEMAAVVPEDNDAIDGDNTYTLPAIEASYALSFDRFSLKAAGGYQTYETTEDSVNYYDVDAYVLALGGSAEFGMGYIKGNVFTGQNASNMISVNVDITDASDPAALPIDTGDDGDIDDVDDFGYLLVVGAKLNDMFTVEAGYGYSDSQRESDTEENEVSSYYLQSTVTIAPGVSVIPEICVIDGDEDGEQEKITFGARWKIDF